METNKLSDSDFYQASENQEFQQQIEANQLNKNSKLEEKQELLETQQVLKDLQNNYKQRFAEVLKIYQAQSPEAKAKSNLADLLQNSEYQDSPEVKVFLSAREELLNKIKELKSDLQGDQINQESVKLLHSFMSPDLLKKVEAEVKELEKEYFNMLLNHPGKKELSKNLKDIPSDASTWKMQGGKLNLDFSKNY
ncbi:MAG TPA: hypothetical protein PLQ36_00390 [Candidatus Gracilibacteria bacterium]|nr:hypothetical protein [Candidatus Gracilibacteria bacterium]